MAAANRGHDGCGKRRARVKAATYSQRKIDERRRIAAFRVSVGEESAMIFMVFFLGVCVGAAIMAWMADVS